MRIPSKLNVCHSLTVGPFRGCVHGVHHVLLIFLIFEIKVRRLLVGSTLNRHYSGWQLKAHYEKCFKGFYKEKFMKGDIMNPCVEEWGDYQDCVKATLKARKIATMLQKELSKEQGTKS